MQTINEYLLNVVVPNLMEDQYFMQQSVWDQMESDGDMESAVFSFTENGFNDYHNRGHNLSQQNKEYLALFDKSSVLLEAMHFSKKYSMDNYDTYNEDAERTVADVANAYAYFWCLDNREKLTKMFENLEDYDETPCPCKDCGKLHPFDECEDDAEENEGEGKYDNDVLVKNDCGWCTSCNEWIQMNKFVGAKMGDTDFVVAQPCFQCRTRNAKQIFICDDCDKNIDECDCGKLCKCDNCEENINPEKNNIYILTNKPEEITICSSCFDDLGEEYKENGWECDDFEDDDEEEDA